MAITTDVCINLLNVTFKFTRLTKKLNNVAMMSTSEGMPVGNVSLKKYREKAKAKKE